MAEPQTWVELVRELAEALDSLTEYANVSMYEDLIQYARRAAAMGESWPNG